MILDIFVSKHTIIGEELAFIMAAMKKDITEQTAFVIAEHINKMTAVLIMHLSSEDTLFYPALLASKDSSIKALAQKYIDEMGNLSATYNTFKNNYNTPSKIVANAETFRQQMILIHDAITARIQKEETELYPIAAKL